MASRQLLNQAGELLSEAQGLGTALTGSLTLGCFSVLAPYVLPEIHATCAERYPGLRLVTREEDLDELAAGVLSGRFELGLGYNLEPDARLAMTSVFALPPYLLVPAGHRLAGRRKVRLEQLGGEPWRCWICPRAASTSWVCSPRRVSSPMSATGPRVWRRRELWSGSAWPARC